MTARHDRSIGRNEAFIEETRDDVKRVLRILEGNGQPGLLADVHRIDADVSTLKENEREYKIDKRTNRATLWTSLVAFFAALGAAILGSVSFFRGH